MHASISQYLQFYCKQVSLIERQLLTHPWGHKQPMKTRGRIPENEDDILQYEFVCNQIINTVTYLHANCTTLFNHFYTTLMSVTLNSTNAHLISQWCVFLCRLPPWRWPRRPKYVGLLSDFFTFQSNSCAVVGIHTVKLSLCMEQGNINYLTCVLGIF